MPTKTGTQYRVFVEYPFDVLLKRVGEAYSFIYMTQILNGSQPPTEKFEKTLAAILRKPRAWLFAEVEVDDG